MCFGKFRVQNLKVWHRKFLQNRVLGTVAGQGALQNHCIALPTSPHHDTGTDAGVIKSVRAYEAPSTVEKASNCGRASEPSILQDPKTRCPTRAEMRATVCRAHGASELPGIICRSYLPQASDRASTDPIPRSSRQRSNCPM